MALFSRPRSSPTTRNRVSRTFMGALAALFLGVSSQPAEARECLPQSVTFKGPDKFQDVVAQALRENWRALPMGERVAKFGRALCGTPYVGYTLEIDDKVESASCNFNGLDCWTYFETCLGLARMIEIPKSTYTPSDLLSEIEWTRYRGGVCTGNYLERIHYLAEWWYDNEARSNVLNVTDKVGPTLPLVGRTCQEMTVLWKGYRYLKNTPSLLPAMGRIERRESSLPFNYIPKSKVSAIEKNLESGDIIGIVTNQTGGHCSHVGLAYRTSDGVLHFMHASKNHKKVVVDDSLSTYLNRFKFHSGIIVARPLARINTVIDRDVYAARLQAITGMPPLVVSGK
ncbi:MAG: N-acetylmuramoyl-L-alanine amidase-like domain-containing protein [Verrucomicrobium sp.]|nr:N-acetylmuramoyl-L-alanine amidase-like domain-containing protein [Verrucomicrobium sp.]